ncbi:Conserved oligomeric Golgi complex subunit 5 [Coniochaeta hoffmannii]|uniref:Conserved oligomeric Golgi complex subunit 5 n=1 Tax=Coniochaeta hoffmannii TaxID=91930 RepID=A0AA38S5U5_9PEZI|nr:Conserved oligomeric Golgi complex subunit 5 [Coniochaeta hoffmannii]
MTQANDDDEPSYIDYETFLSPDFSPSSFANTLVRATNNENDTPLDLSTPLSRVLFDIQEIDSHIDVLTTRSAIPLLTHTRDQTAASTRIVTEIDSQVKALNDSYKQLEKEVIQKHAEAEEVQQVASRLWETLKLGRAVGRCLQLGRQLELQHSELTGSASMTTPASRKEDHRALVRSTHTLLSLRELLSGASTPNSEGYGLDRVSTIRTLQTSVIDPVERSVRETSERIIREFSPGSSTSSAPTFAQTEEIRARTVSALTALYLLSPSQTATKPGGKEDKRAPTLMLQALEVYLRSALQSSIAGLARGLAALPSLDRTLSEVAARCQNVVALEAVLESTKAPASGASPRGTGNLLQPLLAYLETGSLASYFWRTLASSLATRVQEIINRGGVSARTLKTNRNAVSDAIKDCVMRGSQVPNAIAATTKVKKVGEKAPSWDREVAVMVGAVVGNLGR